MPNIFQFFSYRQKYNALTVTAQIQALKIDLLKIGSDSEREELEKLRLQAEDDLDPDSDNKKSIAIYLQRHYYLAAGAGQILFPFLGVIAFLFVPVGIWLILATVNIGGNYLLGFGTATFIWILVAGSSGGTVRVLLTSLRYGHASSSFTGLLFIGFIRPTVGVILAVVVVIAFSSGFVTLPIDDPAAISPLSGWNQGQLFLVLIAFVGGFAEGIVVDLIERVPR